MKSFYAENLISINSTEEKGYFNVCVSGEIVGNAAESLITLFDKAIHLNKARKFILDLSKVSYMNSYSFGIVAMLWKKLKLNNRDLFLISNASIKEKFNRLGLYDLIDIEAINTTEALVPDYA